MRRSDDWVIRLEAFFSDLAYQTFTWGVNDCALFACSGVQAMTGEDMAADFRGTYNSEITAARAMWNYAGGGLDEVCEKMATAHSIKEVPRLCAQRGDVVLVDHPGGESLALVSLSGTEAIGIGVDGPTRVPMENWLRAWRI